MAGVRLVKLVDSQQVKNKDKDGNPTEKHRPGVKKRGGNEMVGVLWGVLYANDAGIVIRPTGGLPKTPTVIATAYAETGSASLEAKMDMRRCQVSLTGVAPEFYEALDLVIV